MELSFEIWSITSLHHDGCCDKVWIKSVQRFKSSVGSKFEISPFLSARIQTAVTRDFDGVIFWDLEHQIFTSWWMLWQSMDQIGTAVQKFYWFKVRDFPIFVGSNSNSHNSRFRWSYLLRFGASRLYIMMDVVTKYGSNRYSGSKVLLVQSSRFPHFCRLEFKQP